MLAQIHLEVGTLLPLVIWEGEVDLGLQAPKIFFVNFLEAIRHFLIKWMLTKTTIILDSVVTDSPLALPVVVLQNLSVALSLALSKNFTPAALSMKLSLSLGEALIGFSRTISMLDKKELIVSNKNVTRPDQEIRFPNRGMPNQKDPSVKGDLVIKVQVDFPTLLTAHQKSLIQQAFPAPH
jgi:hypothetical protein